MTTPTPVQDFLNDLVLADGGHPNLEAGACLLEAVSYIAGEPWSDHPKCVSPVLGAYGRRLNDRLSDEDRQRLKPYIPRLIGTAGDGQDMARGYIAADWAIRVATPRWLDAAEQPALAAQFRALPVVTELTARLIEGTRIGLAEALAYHETIKAHAAGRIPVTGSSPDVFNVIAALATEDIPFPSERNSTMPVDIDDDEPVQSVENLFDHVERLADVIEALAALRRTEPADPVLPRDESERLLRAAEKESDDPAKGRLLLDLAIEWRNLPAHPVTVKAPR